MEYKSDPYKCNIMQGKFRLGKFRLRRFKSAALIISGFSSIKDLLYHCFLLSIAASNKKTP